MAEETNVEAKPGTAHVANFRYAAAYKNKATSCQAIIVAPEMDQLRDAWNRLTGGHLELNEERVREVRILPRY
jgi:hypothetical protein